MHPAPMSGEAPTQFAEIARLIREIDRARG